MDVIKKYLTMGISVILAILLGIGFLNRRKHGIFTANVLLNVLLFATFICIFFFTYALTIEKQIVEDQVKFIVDGMVGDTKLLPQSVREGVKTKISNINMGSMAAVDKKAAEHNSKIMKSLIIKLVGACVIFIGLIIFFIKSGIDSEKATNPDFKLYEMFVKALIALCAIGLTEFAFLRYIARYYRSGDVNFVKLQILTNVETLASKQ